MTTRVADRDMELGAAQQAIAAHFAEWESMHAVLQTQTDRVTGWSQRLADCLTRGGRLLVAGNGGSAAEAQHLTAELVGRFDGDRRPFSAIALHADTSSLTAIGNDYGYDEIYARQVSAQARPGDIVMLLSTSGKSRNLLRAAIAAGLVGATTWALTGPAPNALAAGCDDAISLPGACGTVQEGHLVLLHALCCGFEQYFRALPDVQKGSTTDCRP
jgi:type III pantothenate kinase